MKMFHFAQILMELLPFGQSWFSLLEFTQICSNLWKHFQLHPNLNEAFLYCLNFMQLSKIYPNDSDVIQIWIKLL